MPSSQGTLLTVGHSNHSQEHFQSLLSGAEIEVLVDVRSWPHSRFVEWADRSELPKVVRQAGAKYLFLGEQLGGRPQSPEFYDEDGFVLYWKVAACEPFCQGIERLTSGVERCRVAVMCSEENPAECHRRLLVSKVLLERGIAVTHIRGSGQSEEEPGPIRFPEGSLLEDEEKLWRSSRSVSRKRAPKASLAA